MDTSASSYFSARYLSKARHAFSGFYLPWYDPQACFWPWLVWAALLVGLDQFTKQWILSFFEYGDWTFD